MSEHSHGCKVLPRSEGLASHRKVCEYNNEGFRYVANWMCQKSPSVFSQAMQHARVGGKHTASCEMSPAYRTALVFTLAFAFGDSPHDLARSIRHEAEITRESDN